MIQRIEPGNRMSEASIHGGIVYLAGQVAEDAFSDIEGHPDDPPVKRALEELDFFCSELKILGAYRASPYRAEANKVGDSA